MHTVQVLVKSEKFPRSSVGFGHAAGGADEWRIRAATLMMMMDGLASVRVVRVDE